MENINTNISPLTGNKKLTNMIKTASLCGAIILACNFSIFLINTVYDIIFILSSERASTISGALITNSGTLTAYIIAAAPDILMAVYLLVFYKKNPLHRIFKSHFFALIGTNLIVVFSFFPTLITSREYGTDSLSVINPFINIFNSVAVIIITALQLIIVYGKLKSYRTARVLQIISLLSYITLMLISILLNFKSSDNSVFFQKLIIISLNITGHIGKIIFWNACVNDDTQALIPVKTPPASYPAYTQPYAVPTPVQQPVYQQPIQPVYQQPVQPIYQQSAVQNDTSAKLTQIKQLLDNGLISQEDYEKKKKEILDTI